MAGRENGRRRHLVLAGTAKSTAFTAHASPRDKPRLAPELDRAGHGAHLQAQVASLKRLAESSKDSQRDNGLVSGLGLQIQFFSQPDVELAFESLQNERQKIELLSLR